jgi:hypothetical protein
MSYYFENYFHHHLRHLELPNLQDHLELLEQEQHQHRLLHIHLRLQGHRSGCKQMGEFLVSLASEG